jgi:hypothetical protein
MKWTNRAFLPLLMAVLLLGCAGTQTTVNTPPPPQVTVAQSVNALAQAVDGAVTAAIAARDAGKVSQADVVSIEAFCKAIAVAGKQIDAELRSADDWPTQKNKIVGIVSNAGIGVLKGKISPAAQALVTSLLIVANQISSAVGGPTL